MWHLAHKCLASALLRTKWHKMPIFAWRGMLLSHISWSFTFNMPRTYTLLHLLGWILFIKLFSVV